MCSNYTQRCEQTIHNSIHNLLYHSPIYVSIFSFNLLYLVYILSTLVTYAHKCISYTHYVDNYILTYTHFLQLSPQQIFKQESLTFLDNKKEVALRQPLLKFIFRHTLQEVVPIFYLLLVEVLLLFLYLLQCGGNVLVLQANLK